MPKLFKLIAMFQWYYQKLVLVMMILDLISKKRFRYFWPPIIYAAFQ